MPELQQRTSPLVVIALEIEGQGLFESADIDVLYTGLGKVNAALVLARKLATLRAQGQLPELVVNFGTAGSRTFATRSVVACRKFVQRDMDVTGLGFALGETPFESLPAMLEFPVVFPHLPEGVCGTGDRFETGEIPMACDVIDMEGYALAKACLGENVPFACAKYISDGADHSAADDWQQSLAGAAAAFLALYRELRA
ncbi:MAG: 5'-nucleosidase [Pseudomonadota bacterium]